MLFERAAFTFAGVNVFTAIVFGIVVAVYAPTDCPSSPFASARVSLLNYVSFEDDDNYLTLSWEGPSFYDWAGFCSASNFVTYSSFEPRVTKTNGVWEIEFKP